MKKGDQGLGPMTGGGTYLTSYSRPACVSVATQPTPTWMSSTGNTKRVLDHICVTDTLKNDIHITADSEAVLQTDHIPVFLQPKVRVRKKAASSLEEKVAVWQEQVLRQMA